MYFFIRRVGFSFPLSFVSVQFYAAACFVGVFAVVISCVVLFLATGNVNKATSSIDCAAVWFFRVQMHCFLILSIFEQIFRFQLFFILFSLLFICGLVFVKASVIFSFWQSSLTFCWQKSRWHRVALYFVFGGNYL